jgi:two-component system nitrogen regulation response regulator GlnG
MLLGESPAIQEVFRIIGRIARSNKGVLIRGESGTGKELVAEAIHNNSLRRDKTMVAINTAAIPAELLESELFGHEKGAFTGAHSRRIGRFEQAHNSTLFLDEIGDMPLNLQTRLLRVLSEGRFFRVGGRQEITVDVRIIAATNQNLEILVEKGQFRNDLFHRLNVLSVRIPELRERVEDIPILVDHFLKQSAYENSSEPRRLGAGVLDVLQQYNWPGNIRELENSIQQLTILCAGTRIELADIPGKIKFGSGEQTATSWKEDLAEETTKRLQLGEKGLVKSLGYEFEQVLIQSALKYTAGHKQKAASLLGWGRNTLARKTR